MPRIILLALAALIIALLPLYEKGLNGLLERAKAKLPGSLSENQFTQSARPHFAGESDTNLGHVDGSAKHIRQR